MTNDHLQTGQSASQYGRVYSLPDEESLSLGSSIRQIMDEQISPMIQKSETIFELWQQLVPDELYEHCRIIELLNGQLKVEVDSPSYCYTLKLLSEELLERIKQQCPSARVKRIKFIPG